tara:strand:+ start:436 stop:618 length:183 start_codon:yes stop_codon:yes gene_type:complete
MKTNICVHQHPCALRRIVTDIAAEHDENREAQNQRQWDRIIAGAEMSGDSLDYDGPVTWA